MALQVATTLETGIELLEAYYRVVEVSLRIGYSSSDVKGASVLVAVYRDSIARSEGKPTIMVEMYHVPEVEYDTYFGYAKLDEVGVNPIGQAYTYLKSLPKFVNAINV